MYEIKRIIPDFDIKLPTCMYTVKSLSSIRVDNDDETDNSTAMAELQARQDKLFLQLEELKKQLHLLKSDLDLSEKTEKPVKPSKIKKSTSSSAVKIQEDFKYEPLHDIVINAHPQYIPYGLLAMKNIWKDRFDMNVTVHSHSTIQTLPPDAIEFEKNITKQSTNGQTERRVNVTLIWKNAEHTEMISSPTMYIPIYGEVNIIRYLARVGPLEYRYENSNLCNDIDAILDICYQLLRCSTNKSRQNLFKSLNNRLKKQEFFGEDSMSIADVAVCSTIRRMPQSEKDLTENMKKWLERVKKYTLI